MKLPIKANTKNIVITIVAILMIVSIADNFIDLVKIGKEKRGWSEQKKKELFERTKKEFSVQFPEFSEYPEIINDYIN